jgi:hypothetical protein
MDFRINATLALPTDVPIKPKETYVFTIHDMDRRGWEWNKEKKNRPDPSKVVLMFIDLSFGDGTGFDGTDAKPYPYKREKRSACREGPSQILAEGPAIDRKIGMHGNLPNHLLFTITGRLGAGYFFTSMRFLSFRRSLSTFRIRVVDRGGETWEFSGLVDYAGCW